MRVLLLPVYIFCSIHIVIHMVVRILARNVVHIVVHFIVVHNAIHMRAKRVGLVVLSPPRLEGQKMSGENRSFISENSIF